MSIEKKLSAEELKKLSDEELEEYLESREVYLNFKGKLGASIDENKRMAIPTKYRDALGRKFVACHAPGPCIYLFPLQNWKTICNQLNEKCNATPDSQELDWQRRRLNSNSEDLNFDGKGRFTLPDEMCDHAKLDGEVLIIGNMKHLEVWNPETYKTAEETGTFLSHGSMIPYLNY